MDAHEYVVQGSVRLRRGSLMRFADAPGVTLYVWTGALWITEEGESEDRVIGPGGWFRIAGRGVALASALKASSLSITAPRPAPFAHAIELLRAGSAAREPLAA